MGSVLNIPVSIELFGICPVRKSVIDHTTTRAGAKCRRPLSPTRLLMVDASLLQSLHRAQPDRAA